jgi:CRISPR/Cas system-associated exonuclease Cas4 (RecB family)
MKMYNNSEKISASEISKYAYCPYSWYYERLYGRRHIRKLYLERLEELNLTDEIGIKFAKGRDFHDEDFGKGQSWVKIAFIFVIFIVILAILYYLRFIL